MQVAPEAALLLPHVDEAFAGTLQFVRQANGVDGDTRLPGEVVQEAPVGGGEVFSWRAGSYGEFADCLPRRGRPTLGLACD